MKATDLKSNMVIRYDGDTILIRDVQIQNPSSRSGNTLYKARGRNLITRQKFEHNFKGDDVLQTLEFERRPVQFLFQDTETCTFMDNESYEQHTLSKESLEDELLYISEGIEGLFATLVDDQLLGIELPTTVILEIIETAPAIKGASASARSKPATMSTGLIVLIPEYLASGEKIKINTQTGTFSSRA